MAKRVFFSFHYDDVASFRANVVRNAWVTAERAASGYFDASIWEEAKKQGDLALKRLINGALENTTVTCVLIGSGTYKRDWVAYEVFKSIERGNHIVGVHVNCIKDKDQSTCALGPNPFEYMGLMVSQDGRKAGTRVFRGGKWTDFDLLPSIDLPVQLGRNHAGTIVQLSKLFKVYDWKSNDGYNNFANWVA